MCSCIAVEMMRHANYLRALGRGQEATVGTLHYGATPFEVDDDVLRHFAVVAVAKLRRHEPFLVLVHADDEGLERLWMHPAVDLRVATDRSSAPLDPARVERMMREANAPGGLDLAAAWLASEPARRR